MNRTSSITRYAGAHASAALAPLPRPTVPHPRTSLPCPVPATTLIPVPALDRIDREACLAQLAAAITSGTPPPDLVAGIVVAALSSLRLGAEEREAAWDGYLLARRRLDDILDGSPAMAGAMSVFEASAAAQAWLDRLLDAAPDPDMGVPRQP
jgi:hypothetical protein